MKKFNLIVSLILFSFCVQAQTEKPADAASAAAAAAEEAQKQANNPLASFTSFNIQNYYYTKLVGTDEVSNTAWLRFVSPIGKKIILRASAPISTVPTGNNNVNSGIGNLNAFAAYILSKPGASATTGIGPLIVTPSLSDEVGLDSWQAGAAFVYFNLKSDRIQWGGLVTYQHSISGDAYDAASTMALQPFYLFQLGRGLYLRGAPLWALDFENEVYSIPFGLGIGQVLKVDKVVYNIFLEPQYALYSKGAGAPLFALFAGVNLQFAKK